MNDDPLLPPPPPGEHYCYHMSDDAGVTHPCDCSIGFAHLVRVHPSPPPNFDMYQRSVDEP